VSFAGWPPQALDFYARLEADNSKPFWVANRATYEECVRAPFDALSAAVEAEFGPLHLFRPHRDVRFSKDKSPYKTAAGAVTEGEGGAAYYVQIGADGLFVGTGYHHLAPDQLDRYRAAVADDRTGRSLGDAVARLRRSRYEISAREALKTAPRGFPKDHPRIDLLRLKGCTAGRAFGAPGWLQTRRALDRIVSAWRDGSAMNAWLDRHVGPSHAPPPEPG
jgi:uncharacterized protein (TIGR02453 family)